MSPLVEFVLRFLERERANAQQDVGFPIRETGTTNVVPRALPPSPAPLDRTAPIASSLSGIGPS